MALHPLGLVLAVIAGWLFGRSVGAVCGLVTAALHLGLGELLPLSDAAWPEYLTHTLVDAPFAALAGGLAGHWRRSRDQLRDEIRERQRAERALARNAAHEAALLGALPDLFFVLARDGTFLDAHAPDSSHFLLPPEDFLGMRVSEVLPPALSRQFYEHLERAALTGEPQTYEYQLGRGPDDRREFEARLVMVAAQNEALLIVRDVTERKLAESERRRLAAIVESSERLVAIADAEGAVDFVNAAGRRMLGLPAEGPVTLRLDDLLHPSESLSMYEVLQATLSGETRELECTLRGARGQPRKAAGSTMLLRQPSTGRPSRVALILEDRTERIQIEASMARSDRMASLGLLAAGVSHEINNPLTYVLYNLAELADSLAGDQDLDPEERRELSSLAVDALSGARRVREIVRDLKTFSRLDDPKPRRVELTRVLELTLNLSANKLQRYARIETDFDGAPAVRATEARLAQAFLSVLLNADRAVAERGLPDSDESQVITVRAWAEGQEALVQFTDTGVGIPERDLPRIFDPFFTTRPVGNGTGLGLSICHNIVTSFGGRIAVESQVGQGSTFTIHLPIFTGAGPPPEQSSTATPLDHARVLIIDDEPRVAATLARKLAHRHSAEIATDWQEALSLLQREDYDVVICDLMMPGRTGMDLYAWALEHSPAAAECMLFVSGGAYTPEAMAFSDAHGDRVLDKMASTEELLARIDALLEMNTED